MDQTGRTPKPVFVNVWLVVICAIVWAVVRYSQGRLEIAPGLLVALVLFAIASASLRTYVAVSDPSKVFTFTHWLLVFDILVISVGVAATGGVHSEAWILYFALLCTEAAVMPPKWVVPAILSCAAGYSLACWGDWGIAWIDILFRISMVVTVTLFINMVHVMHLERQGEIAELREKLHLVEERERIASDFHDGLGHSLVKSILGLEVAKAICETEPTEAKRLVEEQTSELRSAMAEMRGVIHQLHHDSNVSWQNQIRLLARQTQERIRAEITVDLPDVCLDPLLEETAVRIAQEALTNIMKHSASATRVAIAAKTDGGRFALTITDDGPGFDAANQGNGLTNMSRRATDSGGRLEIASAPGQGTAIELTAPMEREWTKSAS